MKLITVVGAQYHPSGNIDMFIRAEIGGDEMDIPFGYRPGDPEGLGPQLDAWWEANPKFPIAAAFVPAIPLREVKAEAARRIDLIMKDYEQRNALALGQEMVLAYGPDASSWPAEAQIALAAIMDKWAAIKAIRARSNEIEAMSPIPTNYADDKYWA